MESYKHLFAKRVMSEWILAAARADTATDGVDSWDRWLGCSATGEPLDQGIVQTLLEYPICVDEHNRLLGISPTAWPRGNFSYEDCIHNELLPLAIFDIVALVHGKLRYGFEIKHKNEVSEDKINYFARIFHAVPEMVILEFDAGWVLSQPKRPTQLTPLRVWKGSGV